MTVELISNTNRYQGLSTDSKPTTGTLRGSEFFEEDTGKKFRFTGSTWIPEAVEILGNDGFAIDSNHPMVIDSAALFSTHINEDGSDTGTFTGSIFDLVDNLDSSITDSSATNPKYFQIKLNRPIENASVKFCSPTGKNFSNVKIILKDRSGTTLFTLDDSSNDTDYVSQEYQYPLVAWCTMRVEFHTADEVVINWALIEKSNPTHSHLKHLDTLNSTTQTLGVDASWTGSWVNTKNFVQAIVDVVTDKDSATDGLEIQLSNDGLTIVHTHKFSILANSPDGHHYPSETELLFYRLKYTNGGEAQTVFKLFSTLFSTMVEEGHSHNLNYNMSDDHPAPVIRAVQTGKKPNGDYVNAEFTAGGNPKASIEEYDETVSPFRQDIEGLGIQIVGTTAAQLTFTGTPTRSISITALETNTGYIYIGKSNVTTAGVNAFEVLRPGESFSIDYDDVTNPLYVVGSASGQQYISGAIL
jgi:hypothetical protein